MNVSKVLKWLEEESDRLTEECHSNSDPYKTVNNSFLEGFNYALANVQGLEQPQLNENQQIVMEFLKVKTSHSNFADAIYQLESSENWLEPEENYDIAYEALNNKERLQVIKVACQWALEQEEE